MKARPSSTPKSGALVTGVRFPLVAFNVNLRTTDWRLRAHRPGRAPYQRRLSSCAGHGPGAGRRGHGAGLDESDQLHANSDPARVRDHARRSGPLRA